VFNLLGNRTGKLCDGTSRRDFLKVGALGATGFMLPDLLRSRAAAAAAGATTSKKSVVWLWLSGGPTHIETFDPKMSAPVEYRSAVGAVKTNVPGIELGGVFPKVAQMADKMAFVRSFAHNNSGHGGGTHWVMTGYDFPPADNNEAQIKPSFGSILARHRGANNPTTGLPTYVRTSNVYGDGPAWLGASYSPFDATGNARNNMNLQVGAGRLANRRDLLRSFDRMNYEVDRSGMTHAMDSFEAQAFDLILSRAREVFDISREDQRIQDFYGPTNVAKQMLLARRLCEAGVGFVTVHYGDWDHHDNIVNNMNRVAPALDHAIASFVEDVHQRGMQDEILLVVSGEFGRTPRINGTGGRDHWAPLSTLALSGGGLKMGQVIGESSSKAEVPKTRPISPQDLMATIFQVLDLPQNLQFNDPSGRPTSMINGGRVIGELV
jgi:hypothetical protein